MWKEIWRDILVFGINPEAAEMGINALEPLANVAPGITQLGAGFILFQFRASRRFAVQRLFVINECGI